MVKQMERDYEFLDVVESMYAPEDVILDMELEDIHEAEQSLLMGDDDDEIVDIINDNVDPEDLNDDGIPDDDEYDDQDDPEEEDDDDVSVEDIADDDLFDEFGCINY